MDHEKIICDEMENKMSSLQSALEEKQRMIKTSCFIYSHYSLLIESAKEDACVLDNDASNQYHLQVPRFDETVLEELCKEVVNYLMFSQKIPVVYSEDTMIIGDIHGNLRDLLRYIKLAENHKSVIFLGDYVNRGEFSLECVTLIFCLLAMNPDKYTVLRGNHEFSAVNKCFNDLNMSNKVYELFDDVFSYLPIACILENNNKRYFCVHGGITNEVQTLGNVYDIPRPLKSFEESNLAYQMVWADPGEFIGGILQTKRGIAAFSKTDVLRFLERNNFYKIIRAHEYVETGIEMVFGGDVITVFSSSNYVGKRNIAGYLIIDKQGVVGKRICYMPQLQRKNVRFINIKQNTIKHISDCLSIRLIPQVKTCSVIPTLPRFKNIVVSRSSLQRKIQPQIPTFIPDSKSKKQ